MFFGIIVLANNLAGLVGQAVFGLPNSMSPVLTVVGVLVGLHGLAKVRVHAEWAVCEHMVYLSLSGMLTWCAPAGNEVYRVSCVES